MTEFPKYGKLDNLKNQTDLLNHVVVVMEKLHGTNVRFRVTTEGLWVGSRNQLIWKPNFKEKGLTPQYDSYKFYDYISQHPAVVGSPEWRECKARYFDYTFYGEWHGEGIQKGISYLPQKSFRVFDIRDDEGRFLGWDQVQFICKELELDTVPELGRGKFHEKADFNQFIDINSACAEQNKEKFEGWKIPEANISEGVVIKPLVESRDHRGNRVIAKYKSPLWSESSKSTRKFKELTPEELQLHIRAKEFAASVVTRGRIRTVVEHITRDGNPEVSMNRTGDFLRELNSDIEEENKSFFELLDKDNRKMYNKQVSQTAMPLWKKLIEEYE